MASVYEIITQQITDQLAKGVVPWKKSWRHGSPCNLITGREYSGINVWMTLGYSNPYFLTFKQALAEDLKIKKGAKSIPIVFWNKRKDEATGKEWMSCQYYRVFNCDDIEDSEYKEKLMSVHRVSREAKILPKPQSIIDAMPNCPAIRFGGGAAYYTPKLDTVTMPKHTDFVTDEDFYGVFFHELAHSTGHVSRLKREGVTEPHNFGSENYSKEELVAEFTSAFLMGDCGIDSTREQSVAYIQGWLKKLKEHPKMIFEASSAATKAAKYIKGEEKIEDKKQDNTEMPF